MTLTFNSLASKELLKSSAFLLNSCSLLRWASSKPAINSCLWASTSSSAALWIFSDKTHASVTLHGNMIATKVNARQCINCRLRNRRFQKSKQLGTKLQANAKNKEQGGLVGEVFLAHPSPLLPNFLPLHPRHVPLLACLLTCFFNLSALKRKGNDWKAGYKHCKLHMAMIWPGVQKKHRNMHQASIRCTVPYFSWLYKNSSTSHLLFTVHFFNIKSRHYYQMTNCWL